MSDWPAGSSAIATRIRAFDWSATPLGPIAGWPQSLKTIVDLMLASPSMMSLVWGVEAVHLYNDGFTELLREHQTTSLGQSALKTFARSRGVFEAELAAGMAGGSARLLAQRYPVLRRGRLQDAWFDVDITPARDETGAVAGVLWTLQEVTVRVLAERDLRESETRHRLMIEGWTQAVWETSADGVVVADSPSWRAYTGQTLEEWLGYGWLDAIHPDDRAYAERQWREAIAAHRSVNAEFRIHAPGDGWRWTNVLATPLLDAAGNIEKWLGLNIDIDTRKQAEDALRQSEERYRSLFESMDQGYSLNEIVRDAQGRAIDIRYLEHNPALERLTGIPASDAIGRLASEVFPGLNRFWIDIVDRVVTTGVSEEVEHELSPIGRWYQSKFYPIGGDRCVSLYDDITERKHAEVLLRESEERQRFLLKLSDALRVEADVSGVAYQAIKMLLEQLDLDRCYITYYRPDENAADFPYQVGNETVPTLPPSVRLSDFPDAYEQVLERTYVIEDDFERRGLSAEERANSKALGMRAMLASTIRRGERNPLASMVAVSSRPRRWSSGEIALVEEAAERTWAAIEHARAQTALRESEERLRLSLDVGRLGTWDWDIDTGEVRWSDEHYRMQGYTAGEVVPSFEAWAARVHPDDRPHTIAALQRARDDGGPYEHVFRSLHPDGSVRWLSAHGRFFRDDRGTARRMIGAMLDITDQREWADRQQVLVAELQHRTRNLMSVVRSTADRTGETSQDFQDFRVRFQDRLEALARVQGLLSRLNDADRIALDELIRTEIAAMHGSGERVTLDGPAGIRLRSSMVQTLAMAIHELATNAVKYGALGQPDGRLTVSWRMVEPDRRGQPRVRIDWQESGVHMPPGRTPQGGGQGRELIEQALPYQLSAETSFKLGPDGVRCTITIPVSASNAIAATND